VRRSGFGAFDTARAAELIAVGRADPVATVAPNATSGRWGLDGLSDTMLVIVPTDAGLDGLWFHGAYPRGTTDQQAILAARGSVRPQRD
jgi:hypothetical protein